MSNSKKAWIAVLLLLWLGLSWLLIDLGGFTLKNIFEVIASGIVIFVPIWKKYRNTDN